MKRFVKRMFHFNPNSSRTSEQADRRTMLQLDGLEDRVVLSSAALNGSTLTIDVSAGGQNNGQVRYLVLSELDPTGNRQIQVYDSVQGDIDHFSINSIKTVKIDLNGLDDVIIDDSNGMPFATGSYISLYGSGAGNSMQLSGSREIAGGEDYIVGGTSSTPSTILEDGLEFQFTNTIGSVTDAIAISGTLEVSTSGANVQLTSTSYSDVQTLSGLGPGGGSTLTYALKPTVELNEFGAGASVTLDATTMTAGENNFTLEMFGTDDIATITATPGSGVTSIEAGAGQQLIDVAGNSSLVSIEGNSSTSVLIGKQDGSLDSTEGIEASISVHGAGLLTLSDRADAISESVTVTESTITGFGLFGDNFAEVFYGDVSTISIETSTGTDFVTVSGTDPGAGNTQINIFDDSTRSFVGQVDVNSQSHLNVKMFDQSTDPQAPASLFISAPAGTFSNSHPKPGNGVEDIHFTDGLSDSVDYFGFTNIQV